MKKTLFSALLAGTVAMGVASPSQAAAVRPQPGIYIPGPIVAVHCHHGHHHRHHGLCWR